MSTIPATTYTYDEYLSVLTKTDAYGSTGTRTSSYGYDGAHRLSTCTVTVSGTGMGISTPETRTVYSSNSGRATDKQSLNPTGSVTADVATGYDDFGEPITYTDANGTQSTYAYNLAGRVISAYDGQGTDTIGYSSGGQQVSETDSLVGTFTATYNADGQLITEAYPDGTQAAKSIDSTGIAASLVYSNPHWASTIADTIVPNALGDWTSQSVLNASYTYGYDAADRLTSVADTQSGTCTTRGYTYDADSNRKTLTTYAAAGGGACQTASGTAESYSYDAADRLGSTTVGTTTSAYSYDTQGDVTTTPSSDAGGTGDLTAVYFDNGLLSSQAQNGTTYTWTLDPTQNRYASSTNGSTATVNHYGSDTDSPSWSSTGASTWSRNVIGLDGGLAAVINQSGATALELSNLHGDILAIVNPGADSAPAATYAYTEFGGPESGGALPAGFGYLGAAERSNLALGGTVLMGARGYSETTGRFDSTDPVVGGSANAYDYVNQSPLINTDTTGMYAVHESCHWSIGWWNFDYYCEDSISRDVTNLIARYNNVSATLGAGGGSWFVSQLKRLKVRTGVIGFIVTIMVMYLLDNINNHVQSGKCLTLKSDFGAPYWVGWVNDSNCRAT